MIFSVDWITPSASAGTSSGEISVARILNSDLRRRCIDIARRRDESDQMLDQRLRHRGIDVIVRHVIADAVGAPAERKLR